MDIYEPSGVNSVWLHPKEQLAAPPGTLKGLSYARPQPPIFSPLVEAEDHTPHAHMKAVVKLTSELQSSC